MTKMRRKNLMVAWVVFWFGLGFAHANPVVTIPQTKTPVPDNDDDPEEKLEFYLFDSSEHHPHNCIQLMAKGFLSQWVVKGRPQNFVCDETNTAKDFDLDNDDQDTRWVAANERVAKKP